MVPVKMITKCLSRQTIHATSAPGLPIHISATNQPSSYQKMSSKIMILPNAGSVIILIMIVVRLRKIKVAQMGISLLGVMSATQDNTGQLETTIAPK